MMQAISLIFEPVITWEKIVNARKSSRQVIFSFLGPLILLSVTGEIAGRFFFGGHQGIGGGIANSTSRAVLCGVACFAISFLVVLIGAKILTSMAGSFHGRHNFAQSLTVVAYSLSPLFLVRVLDVMPGVNPWASFVIGIFLSVAALYHGVPRVLQPDPPNAFGIYLTSAVMLVGMAGLARVVTLLLMLGKLISLNRGALFH